MQTKVILLVEDNANDEELTRHALVRGGVANEIVVARDGVEAIDYLLGTGRFAGRDLRETPALILLDLKLPRMDGLEVMRRIRADDRFRTLPIVVLIGSAEPDEMPGGSFAGVSCIRKPVVFDEFARAIREVGLFWLLVSQ